MPRAKANPDPISQTYTSKAGVEYTISAHRDGRYTVHRGDVECFWGRDPLHGFPGHRFPSNKRQADAIASARLRIEMPQQGDTI